MTRRYDMPKAYNPDGTITVLTADGPMTLSAAPVPDPWWVKMIGATGWQHLVREARVFLAFKLATWAGKLLWRDYPDVALRQATMAVEIGGIETPPYQKGAPGL